MLILRARGYHFTHSNLNRTCRCGSGAMTDLSSGSEQLQSLNVQRAEREDTDPQETVEWLEALEAVVEHVGRDRAQFLFDKLASHALSLGVESARTNVTPYQNTIPFEQQPPLSRAISTIEERLAGAAALECARDGGAREPGATANSAAISRATRRRRICSRSASIISSAPRRRAARRARATSCTSSRTRRRVSMRGPISKAVSAEDDLQHYRQERRAATARAACARIRIRG